MNEVTVDLAKQLYALTGWEGIVEWFDDQPVSDDNYPGYTLGYLLRQLADQDVQLQWSAQRRTWMCLADGLTTSATTPEDAAAQLCIQLWEQQLLRSA
jgi:hypothetical protein